jgi:tripartite-type tricarboxylate transporter receptor subunit TctC
MVCEQSRRGNTDEISPPEAISASDKALPASALTAAVLAVATIIFSNGVWSQITPRTIRLVVPYPPGGTADIVARLLGEQIGRAGGPTIVVENRPGGGTAIGSEAVARAAPDGSTLLINSPEFVIAPHLRKPNYEPLTSFEFMCQLVNSPTVIVVNSDSPYRKLSDLFDAARGKPAELSMASTGIFQVAIEMLKRRANVNFTYVPYAGNAREQRSSRRSCHISVRCLSNRLRTPKEWQVACSGDRLAQTN